MINATIDTKIIQLQTGHRVEVNQIEKQEDGTYIRYGKRQVDSGLLIPALDDYRNVEKVEIKYDSSGRFLGFL